MPGRERVFIIPVTDIDTREEIFRTAIDSIDPDGSKYPIQVLTNLFFFSILKVRILESRKNYATSNYQTSG